MAATAQSALVASKVVRPRDGVVMFVFPSSGPARSRAPAPGVVNSVICVASNNRSQHSQQQTYGAQFDGGRNVATVNSRASFTIIRRRHFRNIPAQLSDASEIVSRLLKDTGNR